jgi:glycosyltransferase involved in cell wall biosynthesis
MKSVLYLPCFDRDELLDKGLASIFRQRLPDGFSVVVINDGHPCDTETICRKHGAEYMFIGERNIGVPLLARMMGFAVNYGVKKHPADVMLVSSPEIYHIGDVIAPLVLVAGTDPKALAIPDGRDDWDGKYILDDEASYREQKPLNVKLPFLMAFQYSAFVEIGGYDEDFVGYAYEDNDLVGRFLDHGFRFAPVPARIVHLYHGRIHGHDIADKWAPGRFETNMELYKSRKGTIVRNAGREWGKG